MLAVFLGEFFKVHVVQIPNGLPMLYILPKMLGHGPHGRAYSQGMVEQMGFGHMFFQQSPGFFQGQFCHICRLLSKLTACFCIIA